MQEPGACLSKTLISAGFPNDLPDWTPIEKMPTICNSLDLQWFGKGRIEVGKNEPVIVVYRTRPGKAHAVFVPDMGSLLEEEIVGIIKW